MANTMRYGLPADAPKLAHLDAAADPHPWTVSQLAAALNTLHSQEILVLESGSAPIGFVLLAWVLDEGAIYRIVVAPAYRRQGLGKQLLNAALDRLRELGSARCLLEVRESNMPAQKLYLNAGFAQDGRRKGYYAGPTGREDALLMSLAMEGG